MKSFQRLCAAIALTFALALSVFAGDISTGPGIAPPPPPPSPMRDGQMETPLAADEGAGEAAALSPFREFELGLLRSVLALF